MFSATKFAVAGAIVALFGGFLLAGVMTQQPNDERPPVVGASASATARAEPTAATTSEPEPAMEVEPDDSTTTPDLLAGVDLITEEVEPGVYRVLSDGVREIGTDAKAMTIDGTGGVWLARQRQSHGTDTKQNSDDLWHMRVIRLGEPGVSFDRKRMPKSRFPRLYTDSGGSAILQIHNTPEPRFWVYEGSTWNDLDVSRERPGSFELCARGDSGKPWSSSGGLAPDGACWEVGYGSEPLRLTSDGRLEVFGTSADQDNWTVPVGLGLAGNLAGVVLDEEGIVWSAVVDHERGSDWFGGFVTFDGQDWSHVPFDSSVDLGGDMLAGFVVMFAGSDGSTWAAVSADGWRLVGWDGQRWMTHKLRETLRFGLYRLPDGRVLVGESQLLDGTELRAWDVLPPGLRIQELANAPNGTVWGLMSIEDDSDRTSLYVITPEAEAVAE